MANPVAKFCKCLPGRVSVIQSNHELLVRFSPSDYALAGTRLVPGSVRLDHLDLSVAGGLRPCGETKHCVDAGDCRTALGESRETKFGYPRTIWRVSGGGKNRRAAIELQHRIRGDKIFSPGAV